MLMQECNVISRLQRSTEVIRQWKLQVWKMLIICMQVWQTRIVWLESPDSVKLVFTWLDWAGTSELTGGAGITVTSWLLWRAHRGH